MTGHDALSRRRLTGAAELLGQLGAELWAIADGRAGFRLARASGLAAPPAGSLAWLPPLPAGELGDPDFRRAQGLRYAYVAGDMAGGISSPELVCRMAHAGMLGFYGAGGVELRCVEEAIDEIRRRLPEGQSFGANLLHSPLLPQREWDTARLYVRKGVRSVSASGYATLTPPVVYYRLKGLRRGPDGTTLARHHVFAKVSRAEVAREFLEPAPDAIVRGLVQAGEVTPEEAELAATVPVADRITAEGDSAGHTDNQATTPLLSILCDLRRTLMAKHNYSQAPCIGCAGGIATPATVAAAFIAGAGYVLTGSVNQACREAATSDVVKQMLCAVKSGGVQMAPAGDMFEIGARVQVLKTRTLFASRANKLYELYQDYESLEALPASERTALEERVFRRPLTEIWREVQNYLGPRHPEYLERAGREPRFRMGLVFRWYMLMSSRWARDGVPDRTVDYQVWCGPAMAAFNQWVAGSFLEPAENRSVVLIARNLMEGAALLLRARFLALHGLDLPPEVFDVRPRRLPDKETQA
jgi:PfaD family protein